MPVEIHFITAVVRKDALAGLHPEDAALVRKALGWDPDFLREDASLIATEFASGEEAAAFVSDLEEAGILWQETAADGSGQAADAVLVDQRAGPVLPCPWLVLETVEGLPAARLAGDPDPKVVQVPCLAAEPSLREG
jgi:hypothetical protein